MVGFGMFSGIFIVILFVGLVVLIRRMGEKISHKKVKWILGGYIAIMIFSFILIHTLPEEEFLGVEFGEQNGIEVADQERHDFYDAAFEGRLDELESANITGQWSFEYTEDQLEIVASEGDYIHIWVVVESKDVDDGKIEIASFTGRSMVNGIEFTDKIKPPEVLLEDNQLKLTGSESTRIEIGRFDRDFTVKQFLSNENNINRAAVNVSPIGPQVLYIQVPKGVQVDEDANFQFKFVGP